MKKQFVLIILLIVWGVLSRTVFHIGPNIEFVTSISLISGYLFYNKKWALLIPLAIMFISDSFIGNTIIFIFTWSGFLLPVILGYLINRFTNNLKTIPGWLKLGSLTGLGAAASTYIFFLWTNFGHWLTTDMYPKDLNGLGACYLNALPFLRNQLAGNLIFAPLLMLTIVFGLNFLNLRRANLKLKQGK